ncbi:PREDICTED: SH3 domain-binding protein 5 homolog [Vollenhovia emeryi]|uniref:SH3 domain-binding protein 5 homolog n=1 Tax=Vollenhovia emeryi TaxID=411798 RepID=UPI0005F3AAE8|nr:PREDICTED: SH3 domain-binding protein 5 homolog [Vollenhovia emeryi]
MDVAEDAEAALDPRIQIELENLNNAADNINKLETELDEAHTAFGQLLSDTTRRLKEITDKLGTSCIEKARCYYEALEMAHQAQVQCQQQAQLFQRASEIHNAAKETVAVAEARFMSHQHEWNFDQAWQDMLNHATIKVMDADNQKAECGREHHRRAMLFHDAEKRLLQLEEKHRNAIMKARPYFEVKTQCDQMLATQKERVEYLQQAVKEAKRNYATSLRTLEEISNQIHQRRRDYDIVANGPREPGVGAELIGSDTRQKYKSEFNDPDSHKISPIRYNENGNNEKLHGIEKLCSTKNDAEHLDKRSVDGSESKFTQWELELQASMEKLNRLSIENSLHVEERDAPSSSDPRDTIETGTVNGTRYDPLSAELSKTRSSNQFSSSTENPGTFERGGFSDGSRLLKSCTTIDSTTALRGASTLALKSNTSKSLNSSPVNRAASNFENGIAERARSADISKYVPNRISRFNIKDRRTQSSWDINAPNNVDVVREGPERDRSCSDTNDTLANKSHVQLMNLHSAQVSNIEFLPAKSSSSGHHVVAAPGVSQRSKSLRGDAALSQSRASSNILQKSASCSANSSPVKRKNLLSSARFLNAGSTDQLEKGSISKKFASKTASIKELPLLSFFGQTSVLSGLRGKSSSMINLDNSHLGNIQAISAERLANVRHKLVNDCPDTKTVDVKK